MFDPKANAHVLPVHESEVDPMFEKGQAIITSWTRAETFEDMVKRVFPAMLDAEFTKADLIARCRSLGMEFPRNARKSDLCQMLAWHIEEGLSA